VETIRGAWKSLRRSPGYAAAFIATLGLAIGVNSSVFSVVNAVLLQPLPYTEADRIVYLKQPVAQAELPNTLFSFHEVADLRSGVSAFDEVVEFGDWDFSVVPGDGGEPHRAVGGLVTSNYFEVLGIRAELGRTTLGEDDLDGAEPVMVLTRDYWTRAFGSDPAVLGRVVDLSGKSTRIVGVLEEGAHYTGSRRPDFYVNYATNDHYLGASMQDSRTHRMTDVFARLAPGATFAGASAEADAVVRALHTQYPEAYPAEMGFGLSVVMWQDELTEGARPIFLLLMGTVASVLLLACANLANLTLTRLVRREGELRTRGALGATAPGLRRLLAAENLLLSVGGAVVGVALAWASRGLLAAYASRFTVRAAEVGVDTTVFLVTLGVSAAVAIGLAYLPGMPIAPGTEDMSTAAGRNTGSRARKRTQGALVVAQLALSFALLAGSGLLVRSLLALQAVDPGYETENILTLVATQSFANSGPTVADEQLFMQLQEQIRAFPGVRAVGVADFAPLAGGHRMAWTYRVEGGADEAGRAISSSINSVTPGYFDVLGSQLLSGRFFTHADGADTDPVVVVSRSFAQAYFGQEDPVGRQISRSFDGQNFGPLARIVGVVEDSRQFGLSEDPMPTVYLSAMQAAFGETVMVASRGDPRVLAQGIKEAIHQVDPTRPVDRIQTVEDLMAEDVAPARLNATLFGVFALLALAIASVGVLGVLAFTVSQRTREFGLRMALGADRGMVLKSVLFEGGRLIGVALLVGALGAWGLSVMLSGLLYGVEPLDPVSFGLAGAVLALVAIVSALLPAIRATRVNPVQALRSE